MKTILKSHQSRAIDAMKASNKGCIYVPTGGGKTQIMIEDCLDKVKFSTYRLNIVVVAPRILLAQQLSGEFLSVLGEKYIHPALNVLHVHSGETQHLSTTKSDEIYKWANETYGHKLIFTTYHSLHRIVESEIDVDVLYCDEAHNSTSKNHHVGVAATSKSADYSYFFTATPKYTRGSNTRGMNNNEVYGDTLINVPAPELVNNGTILPPKLVIHDSEEKRTKYNAVEVDRGVILDILNNIEDEKSAKILVAAPNTRTLWNMLTKSDIIEELKSRGYDILHITSKHGAYINQTKVRRDKFFNTLKDWGDDDDKKFVLFHYSILSEGINVPGLTHTILLRNLPIIEMAQTIGRVIRLHKYDYNGIHNNTIEAGNVTQYHKKYGVVTVPINSKSSVATRNRLQKLIELIFEDGLTAHSFAN